MTYDLEAERKSRFAHDNFNTHSTPADFREMLEERRMRRVARVDTNQAVIVKALRDAGCLVLDIHAVCQGVPDLLVFRYGWGERLHLLECKSANGTLTDEQREFGLLWPVHVVRTPREALQAVGLDVLEVRDGEMIGTTKPQSEQSPRNPDANTAQSGEEATR
ncbi:MAG: hypothetical protein V2A73_02945 [Pseudomonadota bacterium]